MNILYINPSFPNVTESFRLDQIKSVIDHGHDLTILSSRCPLIENEELLWNELKTKISNLYYIDKLKTLGIKTAASTTVKGTQQKSKFKTKRDALFERCVRHGIVGLKI